MEAILGLILVTRNQITMNGTSRNIQRKIAMAGTKGEAGLKAAMSPKAIRNVDGCGQNGWPPTSAAK